LVLALISSVYFVEKKEKKDLVDEIAAEIKGEVTE
jgi:hypothetical protein